MSKRTIRSANSEHGQSRATTAAKGNKKTTNNLSPPPQKTGVTIFGKDFPDWNWGRVLVFGVSVVVIISIFAYNGLTPKAFLYSLGVLLAIKTRI